MLSERTTPSAAETIAQILRRQIVDEFTDGDHIGSAEELTDRFHVSGPTLRQAMRILEAEGLVKVRRGNSGGFFASTPSIEVVSRSASALLRRQGAELADLIHMSQLLGPEVASRAASNPDKAARQRLADYVDEIWAHGTDTTIENAVTAAVSIARPMGELSGSPSLALFSAVLSDLVVDLLSEVARTTSPQALNGYALKIRSGHKRLARAIAKGDAGKARSIQQQMNLIVSP
ncbi:MAG: GntR family transcriptional regulator, transcriptional repressor for pyruvate dehydrogenase complex [Mycobacterium sp.]|jgi:DNA-binding FadR family transcriptional regulator|nr:GntR family transcriptional regulator, transcriptional repressor for pyruvate dehydrogenase complex [Mycobacterium sp.]